MKEITITVSDLEKNCQHPFSELVRTACQFQSRIFSMLIHAGVIPAADCRDLAVKYYAPIYFFAQRWLFCGALSEKQKNAFRADAYDHIQKFFSGIGGKAE